MVINGAWFEYDGNWNRETLKSKGPLRRPIEIMIMPQNKYQELIINYEYNVKNDDFTFEKNKYEWVFDHWTDCSVTCGKGTQHIVNKCKDKDLDEVVEDRNCRFVGNGTGNPVECKRKPCATEGFVWAMELTWTECSVTCGQGIQKQEYTCQKEISETEYEVVESLLCDKTAEPNYTRPCNERKCGIYKWESTDEWTECPITCGIEGYQFELFNCTYITDGEHGESAAESFCDRNKKPNITRPCRLEPCYQKWYQWAFNNEWTPCTKTCGNDGVQFPAFFCEQKDSHGFSDIVDVSKCDMELRPENIPKPCNQESCVTESFEWMYKDWGDCSVICGDFGFQTREHYCARIYSNGTVREDKLLMCDDLQPPVSRRDCSGPPCEYSIFRLSYTTEWEECTATCGKIGIQAQKSICQEVMPNGTIEDVNIHMCDDLVAVGETRPCNRVPCVSYKWTAAPFWTNCTAKCGDSGIMYQMHYCDKVSGDGSTEFVRYEFCSEIPMPFVIKECNRQPCIQEWIAGGWSECSVTCGTGKQKRDVTCADPTTIGDDYLCFGYKPKNVQPCKLEDCLVEDAACIDKRTYCRRLASKRRCRYRSFRNRCCNSCSKY